jgi:arylsulfatase A-like enzyme
MLPLAFLLFIVISCTQKQEPAKPNIVLILADDMGYSDIGCFGSEIQTPNIDKLAAEGLMMTSMYNAARCCPSRASLMTGLYPHQAGVGDMLQNDNLPAYQTRLNNQCVTLAEVLSTAGYNVLFRGNGILATNPKAGP